MLEAETARNLAVNTQKTRHGLTLIELLAAIAIVCVLAGILVVSMGKARASARQSAGISVMRNIGAAIQLHVIDHQGLLPGPFNDNQYVVMRWQNNQLTWRLAAYLDCENHERYQLVSQICPPGFQSAVEDVGVSPAYLATNNVGDDSGGRLKPWGHPSSAGEDAVPKLFSLIPDPAHKAALMDLDNELFRSSGKADSVRAGSGILDQPLYGSRRNVLYFDGHVESVSATAEYDWLQSRFR